MLLDSRDPSKEHRRAKLVALDDKKLVIDPEHLDPILQAMDKSNKELQVQNISLRNDVTVLSDTVDLLLKDNNKLRAFLEKKNQDLRSLLETMSENEGEVVLNLRRQISLLNDENKALTYEMSALRELRSKDINRLDQSDNRLQGGKISLMLERLMIRKLREDLGESNLVNEGLQSQQKLFEHRIKALTLELEEETKRREVAEKRVGIPNGTIAPGESFQNLHLQLTDKIKSIKEQEKLQQENLLVTNDKNEAHQRALQLTEELRKRDSTIQSQTQKLQQLQEESDKLKAEIRALQDSNGLLNKKVKTLLSATGGAAEQAPSGANRADSETMSLVLQRENQILRQRLDEQQENHRLAADQMEKMHEDMLAVLRSEIAALKEEKRSLLSRVKNLMERRTEPQAVVIPMMQPPTEPVAALDSHRSNQKPDAPGAPFGIDLRAREPYFRDFDDCVSEPSHNRRSTIQRRRDGNEIEELVDRINNKQNSRSNSPAAVGRYITGAAPQPGYWVERSRPNSMVTDERATAGWPAARQQEQLPVRPPPAVTVSSDLGRTEVMSAAGSHILGAFQRPQFN